MNKIFDHPLTCTNITKSYPRANVTALTNATLTIPAGERVALVGASGSGKSTLLHILGGLERPTTGSVQVCGKDINALSLRAAGDLRNHALGFVYQFHHLLMEFTALENVAMPLLIRKQPRLTAYAAAAKILTKVGLSHRLDHKPGEMSGGERQRAAVARAMVTRPQCILADEPTGNLDSKTAAGIHELLLNLGVSLLIATHDMNLANSLDRVIKIEDGVVQ